MATVTYQLFVGRSGLDSACRGVSPRKRSLNARKSHDDPADRVVGDYRHGARDGECRDTAKAYGGTGRSRWRRSACLVRGLSKNRMARLRNCVGSWCRL